MGEDRGWVIPLRGMNVDFEQISLTCMLKWQVIRVVLI